MEDFTRELTPGNTKAAMRAVGASSSDLWKVEPGRLRVLEGFNARVKNEAYTARVRWIADSIKANGYYPDKPLTGFVALEDGVEVIYVTGGHRRHEGVLLAIEEGADVGTVPVVIKPRGTSMEDLMVDLVVGNEGDPLTTYEQAVVCKRLAGFGWESKEIARRLGYSTAQYVDVLLAAMVKSAGGRVTAKHMPQAQFKKAVKKQAVAFYDAAVKVQADPGFAGLSEEARRVQAFSC